MKKQIERDGNWFDVIEDDEYSVHVRLQDNTKAWWRLKDCGEIQTVPENEAEKKYLEMRDAVLGDARYEDYLDDRDNRNIVIIWQFHEAPIELRGLSEHGGDEDFIALVPPNFTYVQFLEAPAFANDVDEYKLSDGSRVLIGAHT